MRDHGKDHSQSFDAQVFSVSLSFLRYTLFSYLNEMQNTGLKGVLFDQLAEKAAQITYVQRLWQFFRGLFAINFSKIFELFEIEEGFHSYFSCTGTGCCWLYA